MRVYKVYKHPQKDRYEAIKIGFAWWPFLSCFLVFPLGLSWLWDRKLFLLSIPYWIFFLFLFTFSKHIKIYVNETGSQVGFIVLLIYLSSWLLIGFKGNQWTHNKRKKKGYTLIQSIEAKSRKAAIALARNEEHTSEFVSEESYQAVNLTKKEIKRAKKEKKRAEKKANDKKEIISLIKLIVAGGGFILFVNWLDFVDIISVREILNYFS